MLGGSVASTNENPFRCFNSGTKVIHLTVLMHVRYLLSVRKDMDLRFEHEHTF